MKASARVVFEIQINVTGILTDDNNLKAIKDDVASRAAMMIREKLGDLAFVFAPIVREVTITEEM